MRSDFLLAVFLLAGSLLSGCSAEKKPYHKNASSEQEPGASIDSPSPHSELPTAQAARIAAALDRRQLSAQVIMCGIDGRGKLGPDMRILLDECPAGGIMLFKYNLDTSADEIRRFISETSDFIAERTAVSCFDDNLEHDGKSVMRLAPFAAADHEGGSVSRFINGFASLPAPGSYANLSHNDESAGIINKIEEDSFRAGAQIFSLGINVNFAPILEFLTEYNGDFLQDRSYGPDPAFVEEAAAAFMRGMEKAGVLCAAKHFPGSAGKDPHRFLSILDADIDKLNYLAGPFIALIRSGQVRAVMAAHTLVPARDRTQIASLSPAVLKGWLRDELKWTGIIICDDFSMTAARGAGAAGLTAPANSAAAAVRSLAAGADMVMAWPPDIRLTHRAIQNALADGSLPEDRLREAAGRIIREKIRMGLVNVE